MGELVDGPWRMPWLRSDTGAVWLDLLATVSGAYGPTPRERLTDTEALAWWLTVEDLLPLAELTEQDLLDARALRAALRGVALAVLHDQPISPAEVIVLNDHLAADRPLTWPSSPPATARQALARVAREAAETLTGTRRTELRQCADTECGLLFLDAAGRRRWCAAEVCGVRNRVRAHRERTRTSP
ncbi:MAG TPA: ABATE domain-containing protein [Pseudonocardiaceae bacterium]|nr:ABATE domain-containing protein [Pseudonocardiaceae bacterium]